MHASTSPAYERSRIQSTRRDRPSAAGAGSTSIAPAPSDSIQRRKSFSNASSGRTSRSATFDSISDSKYRARSIDDGSSDADATAWLNSPLFTPMQAYFSAEMPARQTPAVAMASMGRVPSSP